MTDVNMAFAEQRAEQVAAALSARERLDARIAAGEIKRKGADRYEVLTGYDRGEVFALSKSGLLLPEHGLDMTTGKAALYAVQTPERPVWHSVGSLVPEGITDIDEVLDAGGIAWSVGKRPALMDSSGVGDRYAVLLSGHRIAGGDSDGFLSEIPGWWVTYRSDTMAPLGCVGNVYKVFQNREAMEFLLDLTGRFELIWETAGALRGGRKVFVSVEVPKGITIDPGGVEDHIRLFIVVINSHDGTSPVTVLVTPWRPVCGNTERLAVRDAVYKWTCRHTTGAPQRYAEARRTLNMTLGYAEEFRAEEEQLLRNEILLDEFRELMSQVFPRKDGEKKNIAARNDVREERLMERFAAERSHAGSNLYAAERVFTGFWDNDVSRAARGGEMKIARATAVMEDTDGVRKGKVHKMLMNRVR